MKTDNPHGPEIPARRIAWPAAGLSVALLAFYLCALFSSVPRNNVAYTMWHFMFDYRFGLARRSLEGEIARHIWAPPYDMRFFFHFSLVQMFVAAGLFLIVAAVAICRRRSASLVLAIFAAATSPLVLKEYLHDTGRQDVFGFLLVEVLMILELAGAGRAALFLLGASVIPLCLVADNQIFLFVPIAFAIAAVDWDGEGLSLRRGSWAPLLAILAAGSLSFVLPSPGASVDVYHRYLESKVARTTLPYLSTARPENWLYTTPMENLRFASGEFAKFSPEYRKHLPDIAFFALADAAIVAFAASSLRHRRPLMRRYVAITAAVAVCYVPLFLLASDWSRWFSNLATCVYLLAIYMMARFGSSAASGGAAISGIVVFQTMINGGFGVVTPLLSLVSSLVSFFWGAAMHVGRLW